MSLVPSTSARYLCSLWRSFSSARLRSASLLSKRLPLKASPPNGTTPYQQEHQGARATCCANTWRSGLASGPGNADPAQKHLLHGTLGCRGTGGNLFSARKGRIRRWCSCPLNSSIELTSSCPLARACNALLSQASALFCTLSGLEADKVSLNGVLQPHQLMRLPLHVGVVYQRKPLARRGG